MTKEAYVIVDVKLHDLQGIQPYLEKVEATYQKFGGKRIVMSDNIETIEGQEPQGRLVILVFESLELAHAWHDSPEYQEILPFRQASSQSNIWFVESV